MTRETNTIAVLALAGAAGLGQTAAAMELVSLELMPAASSVEVGEPVEIDILAWTGGPLGEEIAVIEALLEWDPGVLRLDDVDASNADYTWFISDFLPDPDGINDDITDGNAIYSAWAQLGNHTIIPPAPAMAVIVTVQFTAVGPSSGSVVTFVPQMGQVGQTRVVAPGANDVTGDISSSVTITVGGGPSCPPDLDGDGQVSSSDLLGMLTFWGDQVVGPPDLDGDGVVGTADLLLLLGAWGPC